MAMSNLTGILPDNILRRMPDAQRKRLGKRGQTLKEAIEKQEVKAERDLHKQIVSYLEQHHGIKVGHARMDRKSTFTVGWPDLTFAIQGKACALELKVGTNVLESEQRECLAKMVADGWSVAVVYSLEEAKEWLERMGLK